MNIIFDVDDTLYDQTQPFKKAFHDLWVHKYNVDVDELYKVSRTYSNQIFDLVMNNTMSVDDSGVYRMVHAMKDFGYLISEEEALTFQLAYRYNQGHIQMSDTMKEVLQLCVKRDVNIGVLTNGMSAHQRSKIEGLQLSDWIPTQNIFISDELRVSKPDKKAFKLIEDKMQIKAEDTWYIGDSIEHDVVGAKNANWHMIYLNRRNHMIAESTYQPDYVVQSEEELLNLLKRIIINEN